MLFKLLLWSLLLVLLTKEIRRIRRCPQCKRLVFPARRQGWWQRWILRETQWQCPRCQHQWHS